MTVKELSKILKLTPRRVQQFAAAGIFAKTGRGVYDPLTCVLAYIDFLKREYYSEAGALPCTMQEMAHAIGMRVSSVHNLERQGVIKKICHNRYDLVANVKSFIEYSVNKSRSGRRASGGPDGPGSRG